MEVGVVVGGVGSWEDLTLSNRCLVDLGEPEKDELLAMGKEESVIPNLHRRREGQVKASRITQYSKVMMNT